MSTIREPKKAVRLKTSSRSKLRVERLNVLFRNAASIKMIDVAPKISVVFDSWGMVVNGLIFFHASVSDGRLVDSSYKLEPAGDMVFNK